jgi:phosphoribosylformylglycinamidine synthase
MSLMRKIKRDLTNVREVELEYCYNVELIENIADLSPNQKAKLVWLLSETFECEKFGESNFLNLDEDSEIIEVGPRLAFSTAFSSNSLSMCKECGITEIKRIERSRRYRVTSNNLMTSEEIEIFKAIVHDRMTECVYNSTIESFESGLSPEQTKIIPLLSEGKEALRKLNDEKGLGFDEWDLDFYTKMFVETLRRDPTDVECFDLGQSNSEHSRFDT